jgi:hypothetical protein
MCTDGRFVRHDASLSCPGVLAVVLDPSLAHAEQPDHRPRDDPHLVPGRLGGVRDPERL